jgi:hypothetical protein
MPDAHAVCFRQATWLRELQERGVGRCLRRLNLRGSISKAAADSLIRLLGSQACPALEELVMTPLPVASVSPQLSAAFAACTTLRSLEMARCEGCKDLHRLLGDRALMGLRRLAVTGTDFCRYDDDDDDDDDMMKGVFW